MKKREKILKKNLEEGRYAALQWFPVRHPGQLVDGDIGLGAHVHAGAALGVEVVETLKALFAAGAVGLEVAFTRLVGKMVIIQALMTCLSKNYLQKHAFGYNGSADSLVTGKGRRGVEGDDEEEEGGGEEEGEGNQPAPEKVDSRKICT